MDRTEQIAKLTEMLDQDWHEIEFNSGGWVVGHPLSERLSGSLFDCDVSWRRLEDLGVRGRFKLLAGGELEEL